jgi:hypothetical protein
MGIEIQSDETIELKSLVQDLSKRLAAAVVLFESLKTPMDCRVERKLLRQSQVVAPQNDKFVRLLTRA